MPILDVQVMYLKILLTVFKCNSVGALWNLAHKQTKKDSLVDVVKNIENVGGNICGIVFNKAPISAKKYSESYYYGSSINANKK